MDIYQPNATVLSGLRHVNLTLVVGPSGVGKTTLIDRVVDESPEIQRVISVTSRQIRDDEIEDIDYHFRSREEIEERIAKGEYVQVPPNVFGDYYATAPEDYLPYGYSVMAAIADSVLEFKRLPFGRVHSVCILPPDHTEWMRRLNERQFDPDKLAKRIEEARRSLQFALDDNQSTYVINDSLGRALNVFADVIKGGQGDDVTKSRQLAAQLLRDISQ